MTWTLSIRPITRYRRHTPQTRRLPPGANSRLHWSDKAAWNRLFAEAAWAEAKAARIPKMRRAKVTIVNHGIRRLDRDNLYSVMKPIVDGLALAFLPSVTTKIGTVVALDDEDHLDLTCRNEPVHRRADERLVVIVSEWKDES